ncbi:hypothetical protein FOCC_FOCC003652 [Frankliniella occidentalis]|nr:hypothetical protein FOCC_FOCC003652 [Frankliniella occidentalis]
MPGTDIVSHAVCWDTLRFTRCVQHSVEQLQHVVDLASLPAGAESAPHLGPREHCHLSMLRVAKCAALAASKDPAPDVPPPDDHPAGVPFNFCAQAPPVDVLNDLLAAYFSASECGGACPTPPSQRQQPTPAAPELPQESEAELGHRPTPKEQLPFLCGSAASAAHSTTLLSIVIAVLIRMLSLDKELRLYRSNSPCSLGDPGAK